MSYSTKRDRPDRHAPTLYHTQDASLAGFLRLRSIDPLRAELLNVGSPVVFVYQRSPELDAGLLEWASAETDLLRDYAAALDATFRQIRAARRGAEAVR